MTLTLTLSLTLTLTVTLTLALTLTLSLTLTLTLSLSPDPNPHPHPHRHPEPQPEPNSDQANLSKLGRLKQARRLAPQLADASTRLQARMHAVLRMSCSEFEPASYAAAVRHP